MHSLCWANKPGKTQLMFSNLKGHLGHEHVAIDSIGNWLQSRKPSVHQCLVITIFVAYIAMKPSLLSCARGLLAPIKGVHQSFKKPFQSC